MQESSIGERVRVLRLGHALSQQDLADKAGVSRHTLVRLEAGTYPPRLSTIRKVAHALGVQPVRLTVG